MGYPTVILQPSAGGGIIGGMERDEVAYPEAYKAWLELCGPLPEDAVEWAEAQRTEEAVRRAS